MVAVTSAVTAVVAAGAAYSSGIALFGATLVGAGWAAAAVAGVGALALGFVTSALQPKPKALDVGSFNALSRDRTLTIRQPIATGRLHFGRLRLSGTQTFLEATGEGNSSIHMLLTLSVNRLDRMDELWINDEQVPLDWAFGAGVGGNATGKYAGKVKVWFGNGTTDGDAALHAALTAAVGASWTADHKQTGCAKLYAELVFDSGLFGGGTPNVSAVVRCAPDIVDPRDDGTRWTDNAMLVAARYLTVAQENGGFGAPWSEIDEADLIAAANACDEMAPRAAKSVAFTADAATDTLTLADGSARLRTGTRLTVASTGTLPGGLSAATNYFVCELATLKIGLATSLANARARTLVNLTGSGSGTHTATCNAEPRYTANGTIDTADEPGAIIAKLLSASAGRLLRVGGKWKFRAGVWLAASASLGPDDLVSGFSVSWRREPRDNFNAIKGTFVDPDSGWQPTDFPTVAPAAYLAEDQGIRSYKDAELPWTHSPSMAQRVVRIDLERARRQIATKWSCNLSALAVSAGDTVLLDFERYGWADKSFEVQSYRPLLLEGEVPSLAIELGLAEIDANVFAWDAADEIDLPPSQRTNLPSATSVAAPTSLALSSGTAELDLRADGTVFSRLRLDWTAPVDAFVLSGGLIEIQYKKTADAAWQPSEFTQGSSTFYRILDVLDSVSYDVRIRARNYIGALSDWTPVATHVVQGKTLDPSDVTGFAVAVNGAAVVSRWNPVADVDLDGYDLRYSPLAIDDFGAATPLSQAQAGTTITTAAVPPGTWRFYIKARDTSGNLSALAATATATVASAAGTLVIYERAQAPDWLGVKTDCFVHFTGALVPDGTVLASAMSDAELWDEFNAYPVALATYEAPEIDLGRDATVTIWAATAAALGPGETAGAALASVAQDERLAADSYDGVFDPLTIGTKTLRYAKQRLTLAPASGKCFATQFAPTASAAQRSETGTNVATLAGGTAIVFAVPFFGIPNVQCTPVGGTAQQAWAESVTATGFTLRTATGAGTGVAANANYNATGV